MIDMKTMRINTGTFGYVSKLLLRSYFKIHQSNDNKKVTLRKTWEQQKIELKSGNA